MPDVFLASGRDLAWLEEQQVLQPVDSMLIERGVDFGDLYSRDAVLAFSAESRLQCMPVGISPMVIYYNTELVDFDQMEARGLPVPEDERLTWSFEEFTAAAEFASRPSPQHARHPRRPDRRDPGAVHLLRGRRGLRRRDHADVAGLLRGRHPLRARDRARRPA